MKEYTGKLQGSNLRIGIVISRFNEMITQKLLNGALEGLAHHGVDEENITVAWVPGAFEIPVVAQQFAFSGKHDAIICLGAVIKGETAHFDHVLGQAAAGIGRIAQESGIPLVFEVLGTYTIDQALARAGATTSNKGFDAAMTAVEMGNLMQQLKSVNKQSFSCCSMH